LSFEEISAKKCFEAAIKIFSFSMSLIILGSQGKNSTPPGAGEAHFYYHWQTSFLARWWTVACLQEA
jgi:hypothetical protein